MKYLIVRRWPNGSHTPTQLIEDEAELRSAVLDLAPGTWHVINLGARRRLIITDQTSAAEVDAAIESLGSRRPAWQRS